MKKCRGYRLQLGDIIFLADNYVESLHLKVVERVINPNRKWYQIWKPRYVGYKFIAEN